MKLLETVCPNLRSCQLEVLCSSISRKFLWMLFSSLNVRPAVWTFELSECCSVFVYVVFCLQVLNFSIRKVAVVVPQKVELTLYNNNTVNS